MPDTSQTSLAPALPFGNNHRPLGRAAFSHLMRDCIGGSHCIMRRYFAADIFGFQAVLDLEWKDGIRGREKSVPRTVIQFETVSPRRKPADHLTGSLIRHTDLFSNILDRIRLFRIVAQKTHNRVEQFLCVMRYLVCHSGTISMLRSRAGAE